MDKTNKKNTINITIQRETKAQLDVQRKSTQIDLYISMMLQYFSITGINPRSSHLSEYPERMLKRMEDIVRIIKAIEKNRLIPIWDSLELITSKLESNTEIRTSTIDDEDIEHLKQQNQYLSSELEATKKLLESERKMNKQLNQTLSSIDPTYTKSRLKMIHEKIGKICNPAILDSSKYLIEKSEMHSVIHMVEELRETINTNA
jgi:hypothetical protein